MDSKVRVSPELYSQLQRLAEKTDRAIKDIVEEAVKAYLLGVEGIDKPLKAVQGKIIPVQFESRCHHCRKEVRKGELAYYARYVYADGSARSFIVCLDCYYSDTALAEWYLKKKKLEAIVRGLQKRADELARRVEELQVEVDINSLKKECYELWADFKRFMLHDNEGMKKVEELLGRLEVLEEKVKEVEDTLAGLVKRRAKAEVTVR